MALAATLLGVPVAHAATSTGVLTVNARLGGFCFFTTLFTSNYNLSFGVYTPGSGNRDASTTFRLVCSNGMPFQIALDGGGSGNVANRQMSAAGAPAEKLAYQLYTDTARTILWGDGSVGSPVTGTGGGFLSPRSFTIFGRVPDSGANLTAAPRTDYGDVVTITVTY
jgi:spore coat protein U-like protein